MKKILWIVTRNEGEPLCGFKDKASAEAMCTKLKELLGDWWGKDSDPPYDENGQPRDTEFKKFVREHFSEQDEEDAYVDLMYAAEKFHDSNFDVKKILVKD